MNFGRSGFTQTEELLVLKNHVEQLSPDMVIVFFYPLNDIEEVSRETAFDLLRPFYIIAGKGELVLDTSFSKMPEFKTKCFVSKLKQHSALISIIGERYRDVAARKESKVLGVEILPSGIDKYLSLCTANPDTKYYKNYQLNKILIKTMAEHCKQKGIPFMLVTIDNDAYRPEEENRYKSIDPTFDANYFEDDLGNYAVSLNIEYLGLQRAFRKAYENTGIPLHWGHWNYQGHEVVANALADKLKSVIVSSTEW